MMGESGRLCDRNSGGQRRCMHMLARSGRSCCHRSGPIAPTPRRDVAWTGQEDGRVAEAPSEQMTAETDTGERPSVAAGRTAGRTAGTAAAAEEERCSMDIAVDTEDEVTAADRTAGRRTSA